MEQFKNKFPTILAIVFDLDDTLYDRNTFEYGAYEKISKTLEIENNIDSKHLFNALVDIKKNKYSNYQNIFKESLLSINQYEDKLVLKCLKLYRSYQPKKLELFQGVKVTLDKINNNYQLGIITNGRKETQIKKIKALNLKDYFKHIVFSDELGRDRIYRKPHVKPYEKMSELLNVDIKKICYIGDNPNVDFTGALKLGITCIRVLTGEYKNMTLTNDKGNHILEIENIESLF